MNRSLKLLVVGIGLIYFAFLSPLPHEVDGNSMVAVAESLAEHGTVQLPPDACSGCGIRGRGGRMYSIWYPLLSVVAVPFVWLGLAVSRALHMPPRFVCGAFAMLLSPLLVTADVFMTGLLALKLGASRRGAALAMVAFAFGTIAFSQARQFFAEPLMALLTSSAIYFALDRSDLRGGAMCALAPLAKPTCVVLGPLLSLYAFVSGRAPRDILIPLVGSGIGAIAFLAYNLLRFGSVFFFGQQGFSLSHFGQGFAGLIVSPGRGLIWYCPPVVALLALRREVFRRLDVLLILATAVVFWLVYSAWFDWHGGWSWGPRYLFPVLPGLFALTALLDPCKRAILVWLTALGFLVNLPTTFSLYDLSYKELTQASVPMEAMLWNPIYAPALTAWPASLKNIEQADRTDLKTMVHSHDTRGWRSFSIVPLWWWMLPLVGVSRVVGMVIAAIVSAAGVWIVAKAIGSTSDDAGSAVPERDQVQ